MKFAANLSFLFTKETVDVLERYRLAASAGFQGVELPYPYQFPVKKLVEVQEAAKIEQVLLNSWPGRMDHGEVGVAIFPDRCDEFRKTLDLSIEYLRALKCKQMHILAGRKTAGADYKEMEKTYVENLRYAAERLEKEGVTALIEACNNQWVPDYFMNDPEKAIKVIKEVGHPNLKLLLDIFHLQFIQGNLTHSIKTYLPYVKHIQVAQVPDRGELDSGGEISYKYILKLLEDLGYKGWIGLEYHPRGSSVESLKWMKNWGYSDLIYKA